jgi:hypothetical protein
MRRRTTAFEGGESMIEGTHARVVRQLGMQAVLAAEFRAHPNLVALLTDVVGRSWVVVPIDSSSITKADDNGGDI